ncbi:hypothetical protein N7474_002429 [Penicillium riverlandense]|uniref:uncharacterized protein n=1 Tax=Penicillium riverlandense TaxID=1903569 RepID=UPI002548E896|nr:uncharacterized protein N7474_002429 [Penicillium riverlandense]KAJ5825291.1 hypothetical protein N7474_002429 [Penicillium riverlandense]
MYGGTSGIGTTYGGGLWSDSMRRGGFRPGLEHTAPSRSTHSKAFEDLRRDAEKSDRQFKIFVAAFVALCFGLFVWGMLATSEDETEGGNTSGKMKTNNSSRGWTLWIPLGPLWIGYGSEGFQWSFQLSFQFSF